MTNSLNKSAMPFYPGANGIFFKKKNCDKWTWHNINGKFKSSSKQIYVKSKICPSEPFWESSKVKDKQ
jgi:hypothetical protein